MAWMTLEAGSPRLRRRPVPAAGVTGQIDVARRFLATLDTPTLDTTVTRKELLA
jgi:hypothetical protein